MLKYNLKATSIVVKPRRASRIIGVLPLFYLLNIFTQNFIRNINLLYYLFFPKPFFLLTLTKYSLTSLKPLYKFDISMQLLFCFKY